MYDFTYTKISVLIPFHGDEPWRKASFEWVRKRWNLQLSALGIDHEVIVNYDDQNNFNKCRAINSAASEASGDIFILSDADVLIKDVTLQKALIRISQPGNFYCYPYKWVERLKKGITNSYQNSKPDCPVFHQRKHVHKKHKDTGGIILVDAEAFSTVKGMDERFNSVYGGEMVSFVHSLKRIYQPVNRIQHKLFHLWHPKFFRHKKPEQLHNRSLEKQYRLAKTREEMFQLIEHRERQRNATT